jgi:Mg2+-importing ATPase
MAEGLTVAQASLTGELMPIEKTVRLVLAPPDVVFDIIDNENICLGGTSVATGSGRAVIISTGSETYMASIAKDLAKKRPPNIMQIGVRNVSYLLLAFMSVST